MERTTGFMPSPQWAQNGHSDMETLLTNELVRLRALEPTDLDLLLQWENDPSAWVTGATHTPCSRQRAWQYLKSHDGDLFASGEVRFVVETMGPDARAVGCIDLTGFDAFNRRAEVGILIDEAEREKGYGLRFRPLRHPARLVAPWPRLPFRPPLPTGW